VRRFIQLTFSSVNKALTSSLISANAERSCLAEPAFATA
jgi:hypothetical protein